MIFKIYRESWDSKKDCLNPLKGTSFEKLCREDVDSAEEEYDIVVYEWFVRLDYLGDLVNMQCELGKLVTLEHNRVLKINDVGKLVW